MTSPRKILLSFALMLALSPAVSAQVQAQGQAQKDKDNPIYRITINVVQRSTVAINYRQHSSFTTIDFRGTPLLPDAKGKAYVDTKEGYTSVNAEFDHLQPASRYGSEYLTYVLWAISPEGNAKNLGEVLLDGDNSKLKVTTELQAFGLIVTAEPYFAVTQPSDVVVMENFVRDDTKGKVEPINAKYELLPRGQYTVNAHPPDLKPLVLDKTIPLDLYEAQNAVRIALWSSADKYAADSFTRAEAQLKEAEADRVKKNWKQLSMMARQSVQTAEDARLISLKKQDEERIAKEREAAATREAEERAKAERAKADADQAALLQTQEAARRAAAETERAVSEANAARALAQAQQAQLESQRAANDKQAALADAEHSRELAARAEKEKTDLREQLTTQLNVILQTQDTARGLIVNMSDVVFDTGKATLKPGAREKLAKISGILVAHPGLKLEVEGHTDSVGTEDYNQTLSENRANSVRDYLVSQGVPSSTITARGFGKDRPVASNDTDSGRQLNRRVELVVSGEAIGTRAGSSAALESKK
jgi:outer membrane protein OmpA-like peptidoglycan-associated protein